MAKRLYGSLMNRLMENAKSIPPKAGEGATILMYTDKHAATILSVNRSGKRIVIQEDSAIRTDANGQSESQSYRYEPNPAAEKHTVSLRKDGRWRISSTRVEQDRTTHDNLSGTVVLLGIREEYHDYGF